MGEPRTSKFKPKCPSLDLYFLSFCTRGPFQKKVGPKTSSGYICFHRENDFNRRRLRLSVMDASILRKVSGVMCSEHSHITPDTLRSMEASKGTAVHMIYYESKRFLVTHVVYKRRGAATEQTEAQTSNHVWAVVFEEAA